MSDLDRIITITIDRQTKAVSQVGFGVMLLLGPEGEMPVAQTTRRRGGRRALPQPGSVEGRREARNSRGRIYPVSGDIYQDR